MECLEMVETCLEEQSFLTAKKKVRELKLNREAKIRTNSVC